MDSEVKRVISVFELNLPDKIGPIPVQGNIVYVKPVTISGRSMYYVGIKFLPQDAFRIQPVIDALHGLNQEGKVSLAST